MRAAHLIGLVALFPLALSAQPSSSASCSSSYQCVELAKEAIARQEFETAHDLAWRAVQHGAPNDPALMYFLARTQSLSGRPHDAIVMLRRLSQAGFDIADADANDDFQRARELPSWRDVRSETPAIAPAPIVVAPVTSAALSATGLTIPDPVVAPVTSAAPSTTGLTIPDSVVAPRALAYDAVSRRFVLADESSDTLKIVDELSGNVVDLVSRGWSAPFRTTALTIDTRRGDLWAVAVYGNSNDATSQSTVYRLQLISGRLLQSIGIPADAGPNRIVDLSMGQSRVFLLDALGRRVFTVSPGRAPRPVRISLDDVSQPLSLAAANDGVVYVAHSDGIVRLDLSVGTSTAIGVVNNIDLANLQSLQWNRGSLFAIQQTADNTHRAVRIMLNRRGTTATALDVIAPAATRAASITGTSFYYVATEQGDAVIRRHAR